MTLSNDDFYLVSTPLQVLNAAEARHHLGRHDAKSILVLFQKLDAHKVFEQRLPDRLRGVFDEVIPFPIHLVTESDGIAGAVRAMVRNRKLITDFFLDSNRSVNPMVFLSNQWNREMRLFSSRVGGPICFLDDGTSTAAYFETVSGLRRETGEILGLEHSGRFSGRVKDALFRLIYGPYLTQSEPSICFTRYTDLAQQAGYKAVVNDYSWTRREMNAGALKTASKVHFLGAPFVDRKQLTRAMYLTWLKTVIDTFPGMAFTYIAHWAETDEFLIFLRQELDIQIQRIDGPYELALLEMAEAPCIVASWFSSGLDNLLAFQLPVRLCAFMIPTLELKSETLKHSAEAFYKRHLTGGGGIEILPLHHPAGRQADSGAF